MKNPGECDGWAQLQFMTTLADVDIIDRDLIIIVEMKQRG